MHISGVMDKYQEDMISEKQIEALKHLLSRQTV